MNKLYVKMWNGYKWEYKEVKRKASVKFSWRYVLFLVCLLFGLLVGYLFD